MYVCLIWIDHFRIIVSKGLRCLCLLHLHVYSALLVYKFLKWGRSSLSIVIIEQNICGISFAIAGCFGWWLVLFGFFMYRQHGMGAPQCTTQQLFSVAHFPSMHSLVQ